MVLNLNGYKSKGTQYDTEGWIEKAGPEATRCLGAMKVWQKLQKHALFLPQNCFLSSIKLFFIAYKSIKRELSVDWIVRIVCGAYKAVGECGHHHAGT